LIDEFRELSIVNGFTPNGDQANDVWVPIPPERIQEFPDAELKVYDKRGRLMFETTGFAESWDGTYQGEILPVASYYFTIDLKLPFIQKTYKGVVTLLR
jgi:gliding motility-associated-like protein